MKLTRIAAALLCFLTVLSTVPTAATGSVSAQAYAVIDADTGELCLSQNADKRLPCASTTKIMTALVVLERLPLDQTVTVTAEHTLAEGSKMYLRAGETVTVSDLLYGLLLASGNDAAAALAEATAGSAEAFAALMNARAAELGLKNTQFQNPSGLPAEDHYSSAYDLAVLMAEAMRNETFAEICGTREAVLKGRTVVNHNRLLHTVAGVDGGKTGYTKAAGRCLVSTARRGGRRLVVVTLNAPDDWDDHKSLYDSAFARYRETDLSASLPVISLPVVGSREETVPVSFGALSVGLTEAERAELQTQIYLPRFAYAPLAGGETVGSVIWSVGEWVIASMPLRVSAAVEEYQPEDQTALY